MQLIPAIDLKGGRCVRLHQGDFARATDYGDDPLALAQHFRSLGARSLHVVDLDGARDGRAVHTALVTRLVEEASLDVQAGGGLRTAPAVERLLTAGAARCVVGSATVTAPGEVRAWLGRFGAERIVLALDVRIAPGDEPRVAIHGWQHQSLRTLWQVLDDYAAAGLRHVLCTDVACDGTLAGPNVGLYREALQRYPEIAWQASGGVRDGADLRALAATGVAAAISGRALLEGRIAATEMQPFLPGA